MHYYIYPKGSNAEYIALAIQSLGAVGFDCEKLFLDSMAASLETSAALCFPASLETSAAPCFESDLIESSVALKAAASTRERERERERERSRAA